MDEPTLPCARHPFEVAGTRQACFALLAGAAYYFGAVIGVGLTFTPTPHAILWPPNAVLLAALLLASPACWWKILAITLPAHLAAQWQSGVPTALVLAWYVSNCSEALIGAICLRRVVSGPVRFDAVRHVALFLVVCGLLAPFVSTFLDAAFVIVAGRGEAGFWPLWRLRFFSNVVGNLVLVPLVLCWNREVVAGLARLWRAHHLPIALSVLVLTAAGFFIGKRPWLQSPLLLYASLPVLLWMAVRFAPFFVGLGLLALTSGAVLLAAQAQKPVAGVTADALSLQLFLIGVAAPLWLLAAYAAERRKGAYAQGRQSSGSDGKREGSEQRIAERTALLHQANGVLRVEIEERRKAEEAERLSEARFTKIFRLSPNALQISRGPEGAISDVNQCWEALFGFRRDEVIGRTPQELNLYAGGRGLAAAAHAYRNHRQLRDLDIEVRTKSGETRQVIFSGAGIDVGEEACFIAIMRDVTEQRRAEHEALAQREQLTHLTRVVLLGELSGALAHELNQPLAAILTNAQAARRFMARDKVDLDEIRDILDDIVSEDRRAGDVIHRLRALFMKGEVKRQPLDLEQLVCETLGLMHSDLIARKIVVETDLDPDVTLDGDRVQLQQVLINLIRNACEAMSGNVTGESRITLKTERAGAGQVRISVSDTGRGIEAEAMDRLFEPFFTTNVHGLGFGLAISRAIIGEHKGHIEANNNAGRGATFRITLPTHPETHYEHRTHRVHGG